MLSKEVIEWLNKVRRESSKITRYDMVDENKYNETKSVFECIYSEPNLKTGKEITYKVIIMMELGEFVDYYFKEVN